MNYEKKNARFTGILVLLVLTTSCATHFTYIVNPQIIPNFSKANETMIAGSISCQDKFTNFGHINLAHSISDNQAFVGGLSYLTSNTQATSSKWGKEVTAYYASIGFGNYKRIGSGKILENYSGIGQGSILNEQSKFEIGNTTHKRRSYDLQYLSIYNQTSFSTISKNKWMTTILSVRFSGQYHYKILLNNFDIYYSSFAHPNPFILVEK